VMLKFPVLTIAAHIFSKEERNDVENKILLSLLHKPLSLGDWHSIARTIVQKVEITPSFKNILKNIVKLYEREKIIHWRNETIGHGALRLELEQNIIHDFEKKLLIIKSHFETYQYEYNAINIEESGTKLFVKIDSICMDLYPFILYSHESIYFFDHFLLRNRQTTFL